LVVWNFILQTRLEKFLFVFLWLGCPSGSLFRGTKILRKQKEGTIKEGVSTNQTNKETTKEQQVLQKLAFKNLSLQS
jgi:hypothetical protein